MKKKYGYAVCIGLMAVLSGCASLTQRPPAQLQSEWRLHEQSVSVHPDWTLGGDFALKIGHRGWSAGLGWRQTGKRFHLEIYDPLGRTVAVLAGRPGQVSLTGDDGKTYQAMSAATLMKRVLGWSLPVDGLRYWVRGLPVPDRAGAVLRLDDRGRLKQLKQDGWNVLYRDYNYDTRGALPTRMVMTHGNVRLILVVNRWGS